MQPLSPAPGIQSPDIHRVDDQTGFANLIDACRKAGHICFDIESNGFYHYRERTCIITITVPSGHYVVDSLALWDSIRDLGPFFANPEIRCICHGGSYDITSLKRDFGFEFSGLRDTHIAASLLGKPSTGLAALALSYFGIELPKELQRHDWTRRPITKEQLAYLAGDTQHLSQLADLLHGEIAAADLMQEYLIECAVLESLPASIIPEPDPDGFRRIKNLRGLPDRPRTILQALCLVRDQVAQGMDAAPFRVAGNDLLLRMALDAQDGQLPDRYLASVNRHVRDEFARRAQTAVEAALRGPPPPAMLRTNGDQLRLTRNEIERRKVAERRFKSWRNAEAARRNVGLQAVLPTPVIEELIRREHWDEQELAAITRLGSRRLERYGKDLVRLALG